MTDMPDTFLMPSAGVGRAPLCVRGEDLYETPAEAVRTLLALEPLGSHVWEPACGPGAIVGVLRSRGIKVTATDLIDYGCEDSSGRRDFLLEQRAPESIDCILTNPPFKLAQEFVEHALTLCPRVYMLLRLAFLESARRKPLFQSGTLARVYVFSRRLPMMHRDGWEGRKATSAMAFAWFCFDRAHKGPPHLHWVDWKDHAGEAAA